jgi:predicted GNAT family N-acyltransferase
MYNLKVISNRNITQELLCKIFEIKSIAWNYPFEEQLKWVSNNLNDDDLHVLLQDELGEFFAYLNLVSIKLSFKEKEINAFGVGNVCSKIRNKGYGVELIANTNLYLKEINKTGILFCKKELSEFYSKLSWKVVKIEKNIYEMSYNLRDSAFKYTGGGF